MIKIEYKLTAKEPLLHGSDNQTTGNKRLFRRERFKLQTPVVSESIFVDDTQRRNAAMCILFGVYKSVDSSLKAKYYGYYEPFSANVLAATHNRTRFEFFNQLCEMCGVSVVDENISGRVRFALDCFSDSELLYTMQKELKYLMLILTDYNQGRSAIYKQINALDKDIEKAKKVSGDTVLLNEKIEELKGVLKDLQIPSFITKDGEAPKTYFTKRFDDIPFISGNAVGGLLRRLSIKDYFKHIGYDKETMGVDKTKYHELLTGGNISESTGTIDISKKETMARLCPPVGVLGSALGNMTTTSLVKIGSLRPICHELGFDGASSYWELLGTGFGTRHDTSKSEMDLHINDLVGDRNADQMIHFSEVLNTGTQMFSDMLLVSDDPLSISCFWHMLGLWKDFGYIAGRSARGHGRVDIDIQIPENANALYLEHLANIREEALSYFTTNRNEQVETIGQRKREKTVINKIIPFKDKWEHELSLLNVGFIDLDESVIEQAEIFHLEHKFSCAEIYILWSNYSKSQGASWLSGLTATLLESLIN